MKKTVVVMSMVLAVLAGSVTVGNAGQFRFPVRLSYLNSINDIADWHEENIGVEAEVLVPVGLSFSPCYEFNIGLQIWGDLGPGSVFIGDVEYWNVPVGIGVGFAIPRTSVSPYVKAGMRFPIADGDYVEDTAAGFVAAVGIEFLRTKAVGIQLEVAYDTSEITFAEVNDYYSYYYSRHYDSHPEVIEGGLTVSLGVVF